MLTSQSKLWVFSSFCDDIIYRSVHCPGFRHRTNNLTSILIILIDWFLTPTLAVF